MGGSTQSREGILTKWVEQQKSEKEQENNGWNNTYQSRTRNKMGGRTNIRVGIGTKWVDMNMNMKRMGVKTHNRVGIGTQQVEQKISEKEQEHNGRRKTY